MNITTHNNHREAKRATAEFVIESLESNRRIDAGDVTDSIALVSSAYNNAIANAHRRELEKAQSKLATTNASLKQAKEYMAKGNYDAILLIALELDILDATETEATFGPF